MQTVPVPSLLSQRRRHWGRYPCIRKVQTRHHLAPSPMCHILVSAGITLAGILSRAAYNMVVSPMRKLVRVWGRDNKLNSVQR